MRYLAMLLLINTTANADGLTPNLDDGTADIQVTVMADGALLEGAVVRLDLNNNGFWEEHLGEPEERTGADGVADFGTIVSIQNPGEDDPADIIDWHPARILTGNLRGTVGARDVQLDFVLPAGVGPASLSLHDLRGRRLARTHGIGDLVLNMPGGLSSGVYFVRLSAEPAAPVVHRITSVGQRVQTVRARQVSAAEAVAAGWLESRTPAGKRKNRDGGHPITVMVSHVDHGGMNQAVVVTSGLNEKTVVIPVLDEGFVHIPAGTFTMGSPDGEPGRFINEGPQHQVTLTQGFFMSKYEVTEKLWAEIMNEDLTDSQLPKNSVSWDMVVLFCNELSIAEGLAPVYTIHGPDGNATWNQDADGYRLPTEAEWEYACRAATTMAFHNDTSCLSSDVEANYDGRYPLTGCPSGGNLGEPAAVGGFPSNPWGVRDMHGNVWEWVWCGRRTYTSNAQEDAVHDVDPGAYRVIRSGSWFNHARHCRSAYRNYSNPGNAFVDLGFRPVRSVFR